MPFGVDDDLLPLVNDPLAVDDVLVEVPADREVQDDSPDSLRLLDQRHRLPQVEAAGHLGQRRAVHDGN
jgi:hypothetical protein